jgi:large subunit ribosomal protein L35
MGRIIVTTYRLRPLRGDLILRALFEKRRLIMRRPKGVRTKKSVAKRFKITAGGKVLFHHAGRRHLNQSKSSKRRRNLGKAGRVHSTDEYRIKQSLQFSR